MLDDPTAYAGDTGLGAALSAAATRAAEQASHGEERAAAEFRSVAHPDRVPTPRGTSAMSRLTSRIAAVPAAILGAAGLVVAGGGIALAASQGAVHVPFTGHDNRPADAPSATATVNPGLTHTDEPTDDATDEATDEATEGAEATPGATPSPSLHGLCVAFQAGAMDHAATNPAFTALQTAAGGADNVAAYCVGLIGERSHPTHPAKPTQAATPHVRPSHPTHPSRPTQAPDKPEKPSRAASH
jgi:hypothetical protein